MAGVSTATVSRVINQTAWVEPVTRERVEKAMRDLNYRRNAAAIALAKRSGDMLGLLTGNLADPFFARLARGVEDVSRKQQYRKDTVGKTSSTQWWINWLRQCRLS